MVGLTTKQKDELNVAILEYLIKHGFTQAAQHFSDEAGVEPPGADTPSMKKDLLEKKWTSVVRLKKQVMELEKQSK